MRRANAALRKVDMSKVLFDFTDASAIQAWTAIDDRVMGGVSRSSLQHDPAGHAVFKGTVSLERNGGFASVRSSPADRSQAGSTSCLIELRGDHKQFKLSLLTDDGFDSLNTGPGPNPAGRTDDRRPTSGALRAPRAADQPGLSARGPGPSRGASTCPGRR